MRRIALAVLLMPLSACAGVGGGASRVSYGEVTAIAEARRLPVDRVVTVEGVVTVASRTFDAGFALQDVTGGIYVNADSSAVHVLGERVRVEGGRMDNHGLVGLRPSRIERRGGGRLPEPRAVTTGEVGSETEGVLVRVAGTVTGDVVDDQPWGWKITLDDGSGPLLVFVAAPSRIDVSGIRAGTRLEATGFSGRYDDHFEVLPRTQADLRVLP